MSITLPSAMHKHFWHFVLRNILFSIIVTLQAVIVSVAILNLSAAFKGHYYATEITEN